MNDTGDNSTESIQSQASDSNPASDEGTVSKQKQNATEKSTDQPLAVPPKRRIAIGTQRPDATQPDTASRYTYVTSEPSSNAADTLPPTDPNTSLNPQDGTIDGKKTQKDRRQKRSGRDSKASSFTDSLPPQKRVSIPNLR